MLLKLLYMKMVIRSSVILIASLFISVSGNETYSVTNSQLMSLYDIVIIDADPGPDDTAGILQLVQTGILGLGPPLHALTTVHGVAPIEQILINAARIIREIGGPPFVPFHRGASKSLVPPTPPGKTVFGTDAFGDVPYDPRNLPTPDKEFAVLALIQYAIGNSGNAVLFTFGPLTNVALAILKYPKLLDNFKQIIIVAGTQRVGDLPDKPGVEFNAYQDPEALKIVLKHSSCRNTWMIPFDLVVDSAGIITADFWNGIRQFQNRFDLFIASVGRYYNEHSPMPDVRVRLPAIAQVIYQLPDIVTLEPKLIGVETHQGDRGRLIFDVAENPEYNNVKYATAVNYQAFMDFITNLYSPCSNT